nr:immunoglobulin heavy chain junction region [Macaca mulatta]
CARVRGFTIHYFDYW